MIDYEKMVLGIGCGVVALWVATWGAVFTAVALLIRYLYLHS